MTLLHVFLLIDEIIIGTLLVLLMLKAADKWL